MAAIFLVHSFRQPQVLAGISGLGSYNEGVYFGSALRLVDGYIPYRDFTFLHPPGLPVLLAPAAALGQVAGEQAGLAYARMLTAAAAVAVVVLGMMIVRYRGRIAMPVAGTALACSPRMVEVAMTVELEPYFVLFCLLGVFALFGRDGGVGGSRPRTSAGGLALGFACAIKVWALARRDSSRCRRTGRPVLPAGPADVPA